MRIPADDVGAVAGAAAAAGITVFDTARAYGESERLLAAALWAAGAESRARIVTKGGMARPAGPGCPTGARSRSAPTAGRASSHWTGCRSTSISSTRRTRGRPGGLPSGRSPGSRKRDSSDAWASPTSTGVSWTRRSSSRRSPPSRWRSRRSTTGRCAAASLERCDALGLALLAHSPFGGPKRAGRVDAEETLAWLLGLSPVVVPIPVHVVRRPRPRAPARRPRPRCRRRIRRAGPASRRGATPRSCS